ncbi:J domain-containing protein [Arthrobacter sp. SIMBA_036]|uniref:J domain-containing protein n=1 Tax=Arthrobacter sp. SIMBA_036 TaxID=3085778 RepID=UPI0039795B5B
MSNQPDHYAILQVAPDATAREITHAYRSLLRTHHPDTRQADDDGGALSAADVQQLHAIMQAYGVLSDPRKRAAYDLARSGLPARTAGTPVRVRVHRTTPPAPGNPDQPPLSFGPPRWAPPSYNTRTPRSHS